jgi:ubiquinone/menaquinone biosynthesis C-methylase UbiE
MTRHRAPPREAALAQYRRRARTYDLELAAFEPVRRRAVQALALAEGDTVLDVACGTGLSFPLLAAAVGPRGHIVGIEQSPEMMAGATRRAGGPAVTLVAASAEGARFHRKGDAALFLFTHDVLQSDLALANIAAHLKPGAHIVAAGLQWAPPWALPVNLFVLSAALYSVTTLAGLDRPWQRLAERLTDLRVEPLFGGACYVASGRLRA